MALDEALEAAGRVGSRRGRTGVPRPDARPGRLGPGDPHRRPQLRTGRSVSSGSADLLDTDVTTLSGDARRDALAQPPREFGWASPDASVLKLPLTPATAAVLEQVLAGPRRFAPGQGLQRRHPAGFRRLARRTAAADLPSLDRAFARRRQLTALALRAPGRCFEASRSSATATGGELLTPRRASPRPGRPLRPAGLIGAGASRRMPARRPAHRQLAFRQLAFGKAPITALTSRKLLEAEVAPIRGRCRTACSRRRGRRSRRGRPLMWTLPARMREATLRAWSRSPDWT